MKFTVILNDINGRGGVEKAVVNLVNFISDELRANTTVLSIFTPVNLDKYVEINKNISLNCLSIKRKYLFKFIKFLLLFKKLRSFLLEDKPDIIISNSSLISIYLVIIRKVFKFNFKIISWEHSQYKNIKKFIRLIRKSIYKKIDLIITLSNNDRLLLKKLYSNVKFIPNYIEDLNYKLSNLKSKKIIAVGRLELEKGFDKLINAFHYVNKANPSWELDIYGIGSQKNNLSKLINKLNLSKKVQLKGFEKNIHEKYSEYSIFVLSSSTESFGMVLVEAMSHGLPCISFDCPVGPQEIITNNVNGLLVKNGDIEMLANKINEVIRDQKLKKYLSKMSILESEKYKRSFVIQKWIKEINLLKNKGNNK